MRTERPVAQRSRNAICATSAAVKTRRESRPAGAVSGLRSSFPEPHRRTVLPVPSSKFEPKEEKKKKKGRKRSGASLLAAKQRSCGERGDDLWKRGGPFPLFPPRASSHGVIDKREQADRR